MLLLCTVCRNSILLTLCAMDNDMTFFTGNVSQAFVKSSKLIQCPTYMHPQTLFDMLPRIRLKWKGGYMV